MPQLGAAKRLVGQRGEAHDILMLSEVYRSFTEGFDTSELIDAAALLREAGIEVASRADA
jgi:hypothetical protein